MHEPYPERFEFLVDQVLEQPLDARHRFGVGIVNQRGDYVALPPLAQLLAEELPPSLALSSSAKYVCTTWRPGGFWRSVEMSRSPKTVIDTVRGIGVAVMTR